MPDVNVCELIRQEDSVLRILYKNDPVDQGKRACIAMYEFSYARRAVKPEEYHYSARDWMFTVFGVTL